MISRPDEMPEIKEYIRTALGSPSNGNKTTSIGTRASFSESVSSDAIAMEVLQSPDTIRTVAEEDGHPGRTPRFSILLGSPSVIRRILLGFGTNRITASKAFFKFVPPSGRIDKFSNLDLKSSSAFITQGNS